MKQAIAALTAVLLTAGVPAPLSGGTPGKVAAADTLRKENTGLPPGERDAFMKAAQAAWAYADGQYQSATGLINSVRGYAYATTWDIASGLAALYAAHELGLVEDAEYDRRMRKALGTIRNLKLFDDIAYNKNYSTRTGGIAGRDNRDTTVTDRGFGWSAIDLGRLLVWLRIISLHQPQYAGEVEAIVGRLDAGRLIRDGYLRGATLDGRNTLNTYQEGKLGYEQYAASGFDLWGLRADRALDFTANAEPITVMGHPLLRDRRGGARLTSEPFIMMGLELGWEPEVREMAWRMLAAQEERFRTTGQVTIVSEDAVPEPPYYFYYYTVHHEGEDFPVGAQGADGDLDAPRWISAKAAYAWHALLPDEYTWRALQAVDAARDPRKGWSSGVYEGTGEPTGSENINTAAIILESALYYMRGRPLIYGPLERR